MVNLALIIGLTGGVIVVVWAIYLFSMKTRYHYTSALTCPKCGQPFDYDWVPLVSFTAVRLGRSRYLECPLCHEWSTFNIWDTKKNEFPKP